MDADKREFFRFDVRLAYYIEPLNQDGQCFHISRKKLVKQAEEDRLDEINASLEWLFEDRHHIENGGVEIFKGLNEKVSFMAWLLESILHSDNVLMSDEYHERSLKQHRFDLPTSEGSSKVLPLLQALSRRIDGYIEELSAVLKNSLSGKVFIYHKKRQASFNIQNYLNGLDGLAHKGNWLAKVIIDVVSRLNVYEGRLNRVKEAYKVLSDVDNWPEADVNLGAGGFALYLDDEMDINQKICVLLKVDDGFVFSKASGVYAAKKANAAGKYRTAFQFEDIAEEDSSHIVRYLMSKELESAHHNP